MDPTNEGESSFPDITSGGQHDAAAPAVISTPRPIDGHPRLLIPQAVMTLALMTYAVFAIANQHRFFWSAFVFVIAFAPNITIKWMTLLRRGRADQVRIRPQLSIRSISWADVRGVRAPGRWDELVQVELQDGKVRSTGFALIYLDDLVQLSALPLLPAHTASGTPIHRTPVPKTRAQEQRDLSERAARIKARNTELMDEDQQPDGR